MASKICNLIPGCEIAACILTPVTTRENIYACTAIIKINVVCCVEIQIEI